MILRFPYDMCFLLVLPGMNVLYLLYFSHFDLVGWFGLVCFILFVLFVCGTLGFG